MLQRATAYRGPHHLNKGSLLTRSGARDFNGNGSRVGASFGLWFAEPSRSGTAGSRSNSPLKTGTRPIHQASLLSARLPTRQMGLRYCPSDGRSGTKRMSRTSNTKRYYEIARDCLRSAQHADNAATRDKLLDQAQMWMDTAMRQTFMAAIGASNPHEPSLPDLRRKIRVVRLGSKKSPARERG